MQFNCPLQPLLYKGDLFLWRLDACLRLLLKRMQDINSACQLHRINGSESVATVVGDNLQNPRADAAQRLRADMLAASLRIEKSNTNVASDCCWKAPHCIERVADPDQRLRYGFGGWLHSSKIMPFVTWPQENSPCLLQRKYAPHVEAVLLAHSQPLPFSPQSPAGKPGFAAATSDSCCEETCTVLSQAGSAFLGIAASHLVWMAKCTLARAAGDRCAMASRWFPVVLGLAVASTWTDRAKANKQRAS